MSLLGPQLEAFVAIIQARTVQAAARSVGITQTGVTQRIRALESQLGATLFTRSRRGMNPTAEGLALLRYCQTVRDLEGETLAQLRGGGRDAEARVTILGPTSVMRTRVIPQLTAVLMEFPRLAASLELSDSVSGAEALRNGSAIFALVPPEDVTREMDSKLLRPEKYVLAGPKKWRNRNLRETVSRERIIDFDPTDQMTLDYLRKFKLLALARPERHFVNSNEALLEMLHRGLGYGVLTQEFAASGGRRAEIAELNPGCYLENRLALAWYPRSQPAPYFRAVIEAIR